MARTNLKPKLLYLVADDGYFCSHRLKLAQTAQKEGFEVYVATRVEEHGNAIHKSGFKLCPLKHLRRASFNPWQEVRALIELWQLYRRVRPEIVHHVAMKPVLYGSIIALLLRVKRIVNTFAGMGYLFTNEERHLGVLQKLLMRVFRFLFNRESTLLIVQNQDDYNLWVNQGRLPKQRLCLIRGSGVDTEVFYPQAKSGKLLTVVCAARLLKDKGIHELVEAARILHANNNQVEFLLCGAVDTENPSAIPESQVKAWHQQGIVKWLGNVQDMAKVYQTTSIAVLPSYREGLPKSLLEAAACGLPIVTTDVPGCREIVNDGINGLLVPPRNTHLLAAALDTLLKDESLRKEFGKKGRRLVEQYFADYHIVPQTISLYS